MILGVTLLVMNGAPYLGAPINRGTLNGIFTVQVTNLVPAGGGTTFVNVNIEHRNRDDTAWGVAGTFAPIGADGVFSLQVNGLRELVRYSIAVAGAKTYDGAHVFTAAPRWLVD